MTNIVVLIKQVPDSGSERKLNDSDFTLDREIDPVIDEINEKAVEAALQIKEANGGEVTVLTAGPAKATETIRKALSMGADKAIHIQDDALHGSDAVQTAYVWHVRSAPSTASSWSSPATRPPTEAWAPSRP